MEFLAGIGLSQAAVRRIDRTFAPGAGIDFRVGVFQDIGTLQVHQPGNQPVSCHHRVTHLEERLARQDGLAGDDAALRRHHVGRRFPVFRLRQLQTLPHHHLGQAAVLGDGDPLQLRNQIEHMVLDPLGMNVRAEGPKAHSQLLQRPEYLRFRHRLVALYLIKEHKLRQDQSRRQVKEQAQNQHRAPQQPPEPQECAALLPFPHLAHGLFRRRPGMAHGLGRNHNGHRELVLPDNIPKGNASGGQPIEGRRRVCPKKLQRRLPQELSSPVTHGRLLAAPRQSTSRPR